MGLAVEPATNRELAMSGRSHNKARDVDWVKLARDLYATCRERHTTLTAAGDAMGISTTELSKLRRGTPLSAAGLACLLAWLYPEDIPDWIRELGHTEATP